MSNRYVTIKVQPEYPYHGASCQGPGRLYAAMEIIRRFLPVTFHQSPLEGEAVLVTCG